MGGNCPRWELSGVGIVRVGLVRIGIARDGNSLGGNCQGVIVQGVVPGVIVRGNCPDGSCPRTVCICGVWGGRWVGLETLISPWERCLPVRRWGNGCAEQSVPNQILVLIDVTFHKHIYVFYCCYFPHGCKINRC